MRHPDQPNLPDLDEVIGELLALRQSMLRGQAECDLWIRDADVEQARSAVNLARYLAMRRCDLRLLQGKLAALGVSSLGRAESHALANVDMVLGVLHRMKGRPPAPQADAEAVDIEEGARLLLRHTDRLFGESRAERNVRIMVTLSSEAASDSALLATYVEAGMDIARINCAHDDARAWTNMAKQVRAAATRYGRPVKILMDLAGPKLRTGPIEAGPAVLKVRPKKDAYGQVIKAARLGLRARGSNLEMAGASAWIGVEPGWLDRLAVGDEIGLVDARFSKRRLVVSEREDGVAIVDCKRTTYLTAATTLHLQRKGGKAHDSGVFDIPVESGSMKLRRGDMLRLTAGGVGHAATLPAKDQPARIATIACTLPEVLAQLRTGHEVWFDDGKIGCVVRREGRDEVDVEVTEASDDGAKLAADKGINVPDTTLDLDALTAKDRLDLKTVAAVADIVGMSFAQSADDVRGLRRQLDALGAKRLPMILKIETRRGFENLPELLFASMSGPGDGVMIARGDLAVECGFERIAEVQEEIMWACEAAHMPVVWATQVLETLARTGLPSRAEVSDAAMGARCECVMLNKGPHIVDAIHTLDDILRRMQGHQSKKRTLLRALRAWPASSKSA